jgi:NagD protein
MSDSTSEPRKTYLIDMDGVLVHGSRAIPGAQEFLERLARGGNKHLILTNNSRYTPLDLQHRLNGAGIHVDAGAVYSSAMATARFLQDQKPRGSAFVIGGSGLYQALTDADFTFTEYNPDFVVLGETESYPYDALVRASQLITSGVPFIATNPDPSGPAETGMVPACGAVAALIEKATGYSPYFVGKPNPLMLRLALRHIGEHSENACMVGDRMDTDIRIGLEAGLQTILVLTGVTTREGVTRFPYRPHSIVESVRDISP